MATTNAPYRVLFPTGNQALLAAGSRESALAIGQLGVFNYHTGLSIDGSVAADAKDIYLAVGTDPTGTGSLSDVERSMGQVIQVRNSRFLTFKGYVAAVAQVIDITGYVAQCQTDYAIKINLRNGLGYELNGFTQINKTFNFTTGCCPDQCTPCALGDTNELTVGLVEAINADEEGLLTATAISVSLAATVNTAPTADADAIITIGNYTYTVPLLDADTAAGAAAKIAAVINATDDPIYATGATAAMTFQGAGVGSTVTVSGSSGITFNAVAVTKTAVAAAAVDAYIAANPGATLAIRITGSSLPVSTYGNINNSYTKLRNTSFGVSLIEGFTCNGEVTVVTEPQQPEGLGYDEAQLEYKAQGWGKGGPYRLSSVLGQERAGFVNLASRTATYNTFTLGYDQFSVGGWLEYLNNLETRIDVPCADTTTSAAIATVFDLIFTQFGGMAGDVAANGDCTNTRTGLLTPATDGVESLS